MALLILGVWLERVAEPVTERHRDLICCSALSTEGARIAPRTLVDADSEEHLQPSLLLVIPVCFLDAMQRSFFLPVLHVSE
jgi:hypothetical protein